MHGAFSVCACTLPPVPQVDGVEATAEQLEAVHDHDLIWLVRSAR